VFNRDDPVIQGVVVAVISVGLTLAADLLDLLINPRLRHA
jgi:ABC-type dipeptide/oligopeptide/nickel transport system permease component